jgi:N-methylhydantoinase B
MTGGERFLLRSAGGGGCGDPHLRDRDALARDLTEGYVTKERAERDYTNKND